MIERQSDSAIPYHGAWWRRRRWKTSRHEHDMHFAFAMEIKETRTLSATRWQERAWPLHRRN